MNSPLASILASMAHEAAQPGGNDFGNCRDIRVALLADDGRIAAYWDESWCFVPYVESA